MSDLCLRRLKRELQSLRKNPIENIEALPLESNLREWHYVIKGTPGTPYEGGYYHGKLEFSKEYPMKPPGIRLLTPSGRFKDGQKLCFSFSDFHPESWNPMWSVSTILLGFQSFMLETDRTLGSVEATVRQRKAYADASLAYNVKDPNFCELFPHLVDEHNANQARRRAQGGEIAHLKDSAKGADAMADAAEMAGPSSTMLLASVTISFALLAVLLRLFF